MAQKTENYITKKWEMEVMNVKAKILCTGNKTFVELDGKTIGKGVESVEFRHKGGENATVKISLDLNAFSFFPDGYLDEVCRKMDEAKPPEYYRIGRAE